MENITCKSTLLRGSLFLYVLFVFIFIVLRNWICNFQLYLCCLCYCFALLDYWCYIISRSFTASRFSVRSGQSCIVTLFSLSAGCICAAYVFRIVLYDIKFCSSLSHVFMPESCLFLLCNIVPTTLFELDFVIHI